MFNNPNLGDIFAGAPDYAEPEAIEETADQAEETVDQAEDVSDDHEEVDEDVEDVEDDNEPSDDEVEEQPAFDLNNFMANFNQTLAPQQPVNPYMQQPVNPYMQPQQQQNPYGLQQPQVPQQPQYMLDHMQQMQQQQEAQMKQMQLQSEVATLAQTDSDFQMVADDFMGVVQEAPSLLELDGGTAMAYEVAKARFVMNNLDNIIKGAVDEYKQAEARKRAAAAPKVTKTAPQQVSAEQAQVDLILGSAPKRLFG